MVGQDLILIEFQLEVILPGLEIENSLLVFMPDIYLMWDLFIKSSQTVH